MSSESIQARYDFGYTDGKYTLITHMVKSCMTGLIGGFIIAFGINIFKKSYSPKLE